MNEEIKNKFQELQVIEAPVYNKEYTVKTNFLNLFKFGRILNTRLQTTINFVKELYNSIDINNIIKLVLQNINENKISFLLNYQLTIGNNEIVTINEIVYKINRLSNNSFTIEKDSGGWNVDNIVCIGKDLDGVQIYPKIKTGSNKIEIIFTEPISNNIKIFLI